MAKSKAIKIGAVIFLIGIVLAIIIGFIEYSGAYSSWQDYLPLILVVLGILIGLLNITAAETKDFMMAGAILVIISALGGQAYMNSVPILGNIIKAIIILFVPATIIVALKTVFILAKN
jgi:ATP synthase protein I